uniref:Uncharacterized protein n=1 Tax=Strigamia maritima TaxID=126957 RepID=T1JE94_STRMM
MKASGASACIWRRLLVLATVLVITQCQTNEIKEIFVTEGQDTVLDCRFSLGYISQNLNFYWIKSAVVLADTIAFGNISAVTDLYSVQLNPNKGQYQLLIRNTTYDNDNRQFVCKVLDGSKVVHEEKFMVTILIPPGSPEIKTPNTMATEGKVYRLTCSSTGGSPDPDIEWFREGDVHPLPGTVQPGGDRNKPTVNLLAFEPKKDDDGARLVCRVSSKALEQIGRPSLEASVELNVNYMPRASIHPKNSITVERGSSTSVSCHVDAKPEAMSVKWSHNGRIVSHNTNLNIKPTTSDDNGVYTCTADNGIGSSGQADLTIDIQYGPTIQMEKRREVRENEDISIRCDVSANPPAEIKWFKEGSSSVTATGNTLRLQRLNVHNMGRYICQATNVLHPSFATSAIRKVANATVAVWLKHPPGRASIVPENAIGIIGKPLVLTCQISPPGWPEPSFKWWKEVPTNTLPYGMNYTISSVAAGHEGTYHCQGNNELGISNVASISLKVYEPPQLVLSLPSLLSKRTVDVDLTVTCEAQSKHRPLVHWFKNGEVLKSNDQFDIVSSEKMKDTGIYLLTTTLRFVGSNRPNGNQLTLEDRGIYTCEFDNQLIEPTRSNMTLKIEHGPILRHTKKKIAFELGTTAEIECRMQAYPAPSFQWSFANTILASGMAQYEMNQKDLGDDLYSSTLVIPRLKETDYGEYTCSASNQLDNAKTHIKLLGRGSPEAPTDLYPVNITHKSIGLQWAKGFDGGYPDTTFVVSYWSNDVPGQYIECGTSNICTISGLKEMTDYHLKVQAKNEKGMSDYSNEITVVTRINGASIPAPNNVYYDKSAFELLFVTPKTPLKLVGKLEVLIDGTWTAYNSYIFIEDEQGKLNFEPNPWDQIQMMQVSLCLQNDTTVCGPPLPATEGVPPVLKRASAGGMEMQVVIIIAVCSVLGIIFLIGMIAACYYCKIRQKKNDKLKKNFQETSSNSGRPKAITKPYYPEGIINKAVDNNVEHDTMKAPPYSEHMSPLNNQVVLDRQGIPHYAPNGHMPPNYPYLDTPYNNSNGGSVDSQDSLWLKNNGDVVTDRSYSYEPSLSNAYTYPDDYHHMQEDMMNQRNRDHIYNSNPYAPLPKPKKSNEQMDPYHDISNIPDPYLEGDEKPPHLSFDESLESGYSTPNSRSRRVIREIIV